MTARGGWHEMNARHLAAALAWLRLRLAWFIEAAERDPARDPTSRPPTWDKLDQAAEVLRAAEKVKPPPALVELARLFRLSRFETQVLLLCAGLELDTRIATLCARAHDNPQQPFPTFALALAALEEPAWDVLSPKRPLRSWHLIDVNPVGHQPLTTSPLRADPRVVNYLKGLNNYADERLTPMLTALGPAGPLPPSQKAVGARVAKGWQAEMPRGLRSVIQLSGTDEASKKEVAATVAAALGLQVYTLPAEALPTAGLDLLLTARLCERETVLRRAAFYLDAHDCDGPAAALPVRRFLERTNHCFVFLGLRESWPTLARPTLVLPVARPTAEEQHTAWVAQLGPNPGPMPVLLAGQFNLNLPTIARALQTAGPRGEGGNERLWDACLESSRPRLESLARRVEPKASWNDIVLPDSQRGLLRQIVARVRHRRKVYEEWGVAATTSRGLGVSVLFAGESGTGKTMAAEVLANALRLHLYLIDLSAVVNKYIGETEKNLRRLFDAAEDGGAILFFDEADALFGKRSEVKDSHDRYANIEVNYLLQRMEAFRGLAILATNMKSALDGAFLRRLSYVVPFSFPGPEERQHIWEKAFPEKVPLEDDALDWEWLGRHSLTGAAIKSVALNAAFLAAEADGPVTMPLVIQALRTEYQKQEQPVREADLRWVKRREVVE